MRKNLAVIIILMALTACSTLQTQVATDIPATDIPQAGMPNPASVYCTQNGNKLEIQTSADGSQSGVCVFPDGSTCDEWAYFRGECGAAEQQNPTPAAAVEATTKAGGPGGSDGSVGNNAAGGYLSPGTSEELTDWWGVIKSTESGTQYDDYFERQDLGQNFIYFGIDSMDPAVQAQIEALRDSGKIVHLYGTLFSNVPDYNGSQILVDRMVIVE